MSRLLSRKFGVTLLSIIGPMGLLIGGYITGEVFAGILKAVVIAYLGLNVGSSAVQALQNR